ncbi:MAG: hypothetical protein KAH23_00040 [Kiritimatiellae bacterium]|nr:hypothetical protein [Kiritimatiellia bacterium]
MVIARTSDMRVNASADEIGLLFCLIATTLVLMVSGSLGVIIAVVCFLPFFFVFKWLGEPLACEQKEEHVAVIQDVKDVPQVICDCGKILQEEEEEEVFLKELPTDALNYGFVDGDMWVCICGTRNELHWTQKMQVCNKCYRERDFVLSEYPDTISPLW